MFPTACRLRTQRDSLTFGIHPTREIPFGCVAQKCEEHQAAQNTTSQTLCGAKFNVMLITTPTSNSGKQSGGRFNFRPLLNLSTMDKFELKERLIKLYDNLAYDAAELMKDRTDNEETGEILSRVISALAKLSDVVSKEISNIY